MNARALVVALISLSGGLLAEESNPPAAASPSASPSGKDTAVSAEVLAAPIRPLQSFTPSEMAVRFFSEALRPYGQWIDVEGFGTCWKPKVSDARWAPYTVGHWAYSDFGWMWVSGEDFGSIVYHYGRWLRLQGEGWCWVPDLEWAASWVSWRYGTEFVGWSPLPPAATWQPSPGLAPWVDREYSIGPGNYRFCLIGNLSSPDARSVFLPESENPVYMRKTVNTTNIAPYRGSVFSGGPTYDWVASRTREAVAVYQVVKERSLLKYRAELSATEEGPAKFRGIVRGSQIILMAPEWGILADPRRADSLGFRTEDGPEAPPEKWAEGPVAKGAPTGRPPVTLRGQRLVSKPVVLNGWEIVSDPVTRKALEMKVAREVGGMNPGNYPARPVDPAVDLPTAASLSR